MINVKLALSALLAEIASWSSLWLLHTTRMRRCSAI